MSDDEGSGSEYRSSAGDGLGSPKPPAVQLDKKSEQGFLSSYAALKEQSEDTVRFFQRPDYFIVAAADAHMVARDYYKTLKDVVKAMRGGGRSVDCVFISQSMFAKIVQDLLVHRRKRVEVWGNRPGGGGLFLLKKASPGNFQGFEDILFMTENMETAITVALRLAGDGAQRLVGAAFADTATRKLGVAEFLDNDQFANLESFLIQIGAKECLLALEGTPYEIDKVKDLLNRCNVTITERKRGDFNAKDIDQDLTRLLGGIQNNLQELEKKRAMEALGCLIKYLELMSDDANFSSFRMSTFDLSQYMRLDHACLRALNLVPLPGDVNKNVNLFGLLNKCKTAMGSRKLLEWIKQPLLDAEAIARRHDIVEAFYDDTELRETMLETHLKRLPDVQRIAKKFQRSRGTLQDAVILYQLVIRLPAIKATLESYAGPHQAQMEALYVQKLEGLTADFEKLETMIEKTIDLDQIERHEFVIRAAFDKQLEEVRQQKDGVHRKMVALGEKVAGDVKVDPGKLVLSKTDQAGYFFVIPKREEAAIRKGPFAKKFNMIGTTQSKQKFTCDELQKLNLQWNDLSQQYEEMQQEIADKVLEVVASYLPVMESIGALLAEVDVLVSFAEAAALGNYVRPVVLPPGSGRIELKRSRHPCLEYQEGITFIPNDVVLHKEKSWFQLITGPNMGGKSTYIRQIGVNVLMCQIGSFIPCESAWISVVDCILCRVGASDNQLRGVSTFMAEMLETSAILKTATEHSLIVVDELGRGTSTYDGFGLAWAISEYIATKIGAACLFATHFFELTALADVVPSVSNRHVTAHTDGNKLTMLYEVKDGASDQSFGIHIAELTNFPTRVVNLAKRKAALMEDFSRETSKRARQVAVGKGPLDPVAGIGEVPTADQIAEKNRTEEAMLRFLRNFASLPLDALDDDEAVQTVRGMAETTLQETSPL